MQLTAALRRAVQQDPDRPLTIFGDRTRSAAESADRVARLAGALRSVGVGEGDRVGILALNSDRCHEYLYAVPWAGAALNPCNIRWSPAEIAYSLRDSDTQVLLVDDAFVAMLPAIRAQWDGLVTVIFRGDRHAPDGTLDYGRLVAETAPIEDASPARGRPARRFLYRRDNRGPQGCDGQSSQLAHLCLRHPVLRRCAQRRVAVAHGRRCSISRRSGFGQPAFWPGLRTSSSRCSARPEYSTPSPPRSNRHPSGSHDDPDAGRLSGGRREGPLQSSSALANDSPYGLSATIWTADLERGAQIARRIEAGAVNINDSFTNLFAFPVPHGGWKDSGVGSRFGGAAGVRKYCRTQVLTVPRVRTMKSELLWYPYGGLRLRLVQRVLRLLVARDSRRCFRGRSA